MWWDALKIQEENFAMMCSRPPSMLRRLVFLVFFGQANNRDIFIYLETIQNKHITTYKVAKSSCFWCIWGRFIFYEKS